LGSSFFADLPIPVKEKRREPPGVFIGEGLAGDASTIARFI
jgi:hypothetical protein